ncbi:MAG TPA: nuclear transport factor 2 family protein [Solirubrobacterales bacterium]|nr:nuclear transport factor 2 family protein [Solirubrobacterales bacterium]
MTSEGNLETLGRWYAAYEAGGFEAGDALIEEVFDPQVEFSPWLAREVEQRTYRGHEGLRSFFRELGGTLEGLRYDPPEYRPVGHDVIVVFTRLAGAPREGAVAIGNDLGLVYEFRDGLVRRLTAYGSHEEALLAAEELERAQA